MINKYARQIVFFFFTITILGCAIGPNYKKPKVQIPNKIQNVKLDKINSEKFNLKWWESFQDPILSQLINKGVVANQSVKQALSRVNQSRALARVAFADLLPGFQLSSSYEERQLSGVQFGGNAINYELYRSGIDAAWELDIFGRLRRNLEASEADYQAKVAALDDSIQILISDLASNYFALRAAQQQLLIARKNLKLQKETVRIVEAKLRSGTISELDFAQASAQLAQTTASVPPLKALVKSYIYRISVLCGKNPTRFTRLLNQPKNVPEYQGTLAIGNISEILRRRPDIKIAERELAKYTALIGVQTGELFPKVNLTGDFGYENPTFDNLYKSTREVYGFGPTITWTPFDLGSIRSQIHAADERAEEALYRYQETVLKALEDVKNSFNNYQAKAKQEFYLESAFLSASQAFQLAQAQYQVGAIDLLAVLDAQKTMLANENDLAVNQQSFATAIVNIYKALGGGWEAWQLETKK